MPFGARYHIHFQRNIVQVAIDPYTPTSYEMWISDQEGKAIAPMHGVLDRLLKGTSENTGSTLASRMDGAQPSCCGCYQMGLHRQQIRYQRRPVRVHGTSTVPRTPKTHLAAHCGQGTELQWRYPILRYGEKPNILQRNSEQHPCCGPCGNGEESCTCGCGVRLHGGVPPQACPRKSKKASCFYNGLWTTTTGSCICCTSWSSTCGVWWWWPILVAASKLRDIGRVESVLWRHRGYPVVADGPMAVRRCRPCPQEHVV